MILIADSGSTKCIWLATDGVRTERVRTDGINAMQHTPEQIRKTIGELPLWSEIETIRFYGAGCGNGFPEATQRLRQELQARFKTAVIEIESDLTGAARALFGHKEGVACILGTGSNSGLCREGTIVYSIPPLGYILGDEGSGAALGRNLLNGIFKGHIPLLKELLATLGMDYEQIIRRIYGEPHANRFLASLTPFVRKHLDCPQVHRMVADSFREFACRNLHVYPDGLPLAFAGGVAAHFEAVLREAMHACDREVVSVVESPAEELLKYHYGT